MTDGETDEDFDIGAEPRCEVCGTVMRTVDGGYRCGGCGWELDLPWVERSRLGDDLRRYEEAEV